MNGAGAPWCLSVNANNKSKAPVDGPVHHREWFVALVDAIKVKVRELLRDDVVGMSEDNLRAVVRAPSGGPVGPNAGYFYRLDWFPAALAKVRASGGLRGFEMLEGGER